MATTQEIKPKEEVVNALCGCETHAVERKAIAVEPSIKVANLKRLRRIEGQIRGLQRMVEGDRYCADIMVQIASVQEALRAVGRSLMRNHLRHCATEAISKGSPEEAEAMYDELLDLIYKYSR
jgi:CsoR family transcriptional regulator, copper-sensing transcriptional repressor